LKTKIQRLSCQCLENLFYRPPAPKLKTDPALATDIPKKNPQGAGAGAA
jgi:hypothetical protein